MSVGHYENFPVASRLLPRRLRPAVAAIYWFARSADDLADEGARPAVERLGQLDAYRAELARMADGAAPRSPRFDELAAVIRRHRLPIEPFRDLLDAFSQDVVKHRYRTFDEVLDYCRRSANPVGRLMLHLYGALEPADVARSDAICTALQLANFWQDVAIDWRKGRLYVPQDEMERFGVSERHLAEARADETWQRLMAFQTARARALLESGAPLAYRLPGRIGWELRVVVQGGLRILERIDRVRGDVFRRRPALRVPDWLLMLWRAAFFHAPR
jgi:squalene synthase HpnC